MNIGLVGLIFAVYGVVYLIIEQFEDPFGIISGIRWLVGKITFMKGVLDCAYCLSCWVSIFFVTIYTSTFELSVESVTNWFLSVFIVYGANIALLILTDQVTTTVSHFGDIVFALYEQEEDQSNVTEIVWTQEEVESLG